MKRILSIFIGILLLIAFLLFGIPIEIATKPLYQFSICLLLLLIGGLFYFLFRQSFQLKSLGLKIITISLTGLLFIVYLLFGFNHTLPMLSSDYQMYRDKVKFMNKDGEVIIERCRLERDSTYYCDWRKVTHDFRNGIRISHQHRYDDLVGDWISYDYETNETHSIKIEMKNGNEYRTIEPYPSRTPIILK